MTFLPKTLKAKLHELGKEAEDRRQEIEKQCRIPEDLMLKLKESGVLHLWTAKAYGGQEASIFALMEAVQILSYHNGSLGWIVGVTGTAALASGYLEKEAAKEIFGPPLAMTGGWAAPAGKGIKVEGGIKVSGKWSWGSGTAHCSHILGGILLQDENGKTRSAIAYFNPESVNLIDNWEVLGLKGTNSIDYEVNDLFVPDGQWIYFPVMKPHINAPLYRFSFLGALSSGIASVAIGLGSRALEEIKTLGKTKVPNGASRTLSERPVVHEKIALMSAHLQSAKLLLENAVQKNWEEALSNEKKTISKSELRLAAAYATQKSVEVIQQAYTLGGGSSIWIGVKLEELIRDIHVVSQHGLVSPNNFEIAGRVAFDLPVNEWLL